jgi:hypothetical protein
MVSARSGFLARRLRWVNPLHAPARRSHVAVARSGGLGDVLLCTPSLRELKRLSPRCHVTFYTFYSELVRGLPFIDEVCDFSERPPDAIVPGYEPSAFVRRHLASIMGDALGVRVNDVRPDCVLNHDLTADYVRSWRDLPRPHVVVNRRAGPWTPNKDWPDEHWNSLISILSSKCTVIEIGSGPSAAGTGVFENYVSLLGQTGLNRLVAVLAAADIHVGPISGPVHVAAAVGTPAVVIYGGYEQPVCTAYPGNINLSTALPCSPCWLREPCPIGKECLRQIAPAMVIAAIGRIWEERQRVLDRDPGERAHSVAGYDAGHLPEGGPR